MAVKLFLGGRFPWGGNRDRKCHSVRFYAGEGEGALSWQERDFSAEGRPLLPLELKASEGIGKYWVLAIRFPTVDSSTSLILRFTSSEALAAAWCLPTGVPALKHG